MMKYNTGMMIVALGLFLCLGVCAYSYAISGRFGILVFMFLLYFSVKISFNESDE